MPCSRRTGADRARISCSNLPVRRPSSLGGARAAPASGIARSCLARRARLFGRCAPGGRAPPQLRPIALGGAVLFGTAVGGLRVVFGRHFVTDIIFAGVITIAIVMALYRLLLDP